MDEWTDMNAISQLIYNERHWRDRGQWDDMRRSYHPLSKVRVTWFQGNGIRFVEASKGMHRAGQSKHRLSPSIVRVRGERALAETDATIETRTFLGDIQVDTFASCRLFNRVRRDDGIWRLASLDVIYEKDGMTPVNPSDRLDIDQERLKTYRQSYKFLSYNLHAIERSIDPDLAGDDRPELVRALYAEAENWLNEYD